jgi:hypothetical protein
MGKYIVTFFKNLLSSDGHPFKVLQRATPIQSDNAEDAVRIAQREFERLENVPDWHLHADFLEMSAERGKDQKKVA